MTERIYGFNEDDFRQVVRAVNAVNNGGMEHPFNDGTQPTGMEMLTGKADAGITKGSSGTISVWTGTTTTLSDSTKNVTAFARLGDVDSGKWVYLLPTARGYEIIAAEC